jgi:hypothetical protein
VVACKDEGDVFFKHTSTSLTSLLQKPVFHFLL